MIEIRFNTADTELLGKIVNSHIMQSLEIDTVAQQWIIAARTYKHKGSAINFVAVLQQLTLKIREISQSAIMDASSYNDIDYATNMTNHYLMYQLGRLVNIISKEIKSAL